MATPVVPRERSGLPFARTLVHRALASAFGPPPFDPRRDLGDPGLTGPGSASWRVIGEPAAIVGGIRGLVLQVAHPLAMAGVHDHSGFRADPLDRLQRTSGYVTTSVFGSSREALAVAARVRQVHPHVRGVAPDGRAYKADDPHLLAWVAIALTSSFLATHRAFAPTVLSREDADRFVLEQSRISALLDPRVDLEAMHELDDAGAEFRAGALPLPMLEEGRLPMDVAGLDAALEAYGPELGVNHQGRQALRFLRWPAIPWPLRPTYLTLFAGAVGTLRPQERRALELRVPTAAARASVVNARVALAAVRLASGTSPSARLANARATADAA